MSLKIEQLYISNSKFNICKYFVQIIEQNNKTKYDIQ